MAEYNFPIPGSVDERKIVLFRRKHWAAFIGQFVLSLVLFIVPIIILLAIANLDRNLFTGAVVNFLVIGLSTYYLIIFTFVFTSWLTFYYDIYIVTEDAVIDIAQQGFFGRKISQLSLMRVQDVTSSISGVMATFFGYGNVLVETAGEQTQNFLIEAVPNPQEMCAKIMALHDQLIQNQGRTGQVLQGEGTLKPDGSNKNDPPTNPPPAPPATFAGSPPANPTPTPYQELLRKDQDSVTIDGQAHFGPREVKEDKKDEIILGSNKASESAKEGEVDQDQLNQGGTINLN